MIYKTSPVPVVRDFPEGCSVSDLIKAKYKSRTVQDDSNQSETGTSGVIEGLDNTKDVAEDETVESNGSGKGESREDTQNQDLECSKTERKTRFEKKRKLSLCDSTKEVESDVVNTLKRVIVSGLAASRNPIGSRKVKRLR